MIYENVDKQEIKREMIVHLFVACIWIIAVIVAVLNKDQISWVICVIAVAYLALDELANAFFFWRNYGRVSKVPEKVDTTTIEEE